jgi:hypothetical protein
MESLPLRLPGRTCVPGRHSTCNPVTASKPVGVYERGAENYDWTLQGVREVMGLGKISRPSLRNSPEVYVFATISSHLGSTFKIVSATIAVRTQTFHFVTGSFSQRAPRRRTLFLESVLCHNVIHTETRIAMQLQDVEKLNAGACPLGTLAWPTPSSGQCLSPGPCTPLSAVRVWKREHFGSPALLRCRQETVALS